MDAEARVRRARLAANTRHHPRKPEVEAERRRYKISQAERYVKQLVNDFPPLTPEQRARLAVLLLGGGDGAAGSSP